MSKNKKLPQEKNYHDLGFSKVDHHRILRKGFPEVIYGQGKTTEQIKHIAQEIFRRGQSVLITRTSQSVFQALQPLFVSAKYYSTANIIIIRNKSYKTPLLKNPSVAIVTAGTSDIPVAEEAAITAEFLGLRVQKFYDVGVAGIHRLMDNLPKIKRTRVVIAVAGMEGALPSVLGGLIDKPIIAVPTSVGYGSNFKGLSALLTMLNTCAPGVAVVNIDNGFGAAVMAYTILKP